MQPLIVTLGLDPASQAYFNALRQQHFPAERNYLDAHVTLFHRLPGQHLESVLADLRQTSAAQNPMRLQVLPPFLLGRGVAYGLVSQEFNAYRKELATTWKPWLSDQDKRSFNAHVTVQNKVDPLQARQLHAELSAGFAPFEAQATGVLLWHYLGGPWEKLAEIAFADV